MPEKDLKTKMVTKAIEVYYEDLGSLIKDCELLQTNADFSSFLSEKSSQKSPVNPNIIKYDNIHDPEVVANNKNNFALKLDVVIPEGVMLKNNEGFDKTKMGVGSSNIKIETANVTRTIYDADTNLDNLKNNKGVEEILADSQKLHKTLLDGMKYEIIGKETVTMNYRFSDPETPFELYQEIQKGNFNALFDKKFAGESDPILGTTYDDIKIGDNVRWTENKAKPFWIQFKIKLPKGIVNGQEIKNVSTTIPMEMVDESFKIYAPKKLLRESLKKTTKEIKQRYKHSNFEGDAYVTITNLQNKQKFFESQLKKRGKNKRSPSWLAKIFQPFKKRKSQGLTKKQYPKSPRGSAF